MNGTAPGCADDPGIDLGQRRYDIEGQRVIEAQAMQEMLPERSDDAVPGCPECAAGSAVPHDGSPDCTSGSIASGGTKAHCACEYWY